VLDAISEMEDTEVEFLDSCIVRPSLPRYVLPDAMVSDTTNQEVDKERDAEDGNCHVKPRKLGTGNARVEPPKRTYPEQKDNAALPRLQPIEA
jgi:hypothetical protein